MRFAVKIVAGLNALTVLAAPVAIAQKHNLALPPGAAKLSPEAVAESLIVLMQLDSTLRHRPNDAAVWHRRGNLAWALSTRAAAGPSVKGIEWTRLARMADTSLRLAAQLAPDSAGYILTVARYLMTSGTPITRYAAKLKTEEATNVALESPDPYWRGETALDRGRIHWLRYESHAHRRLETNQITSRSVSEASSPLAKGAQFIQDQAFGDLMKALGDAGASPGRIADAHMTFDIVTNQFALGAPRFPLKSVMEGLDQVTTSLPFDVQGESDYRISESYFRQAYDALPLNPRTYRNLVCLLIERNRWTEVKLFATSHLQRSPWDPWAWMSLGLATHRLHDETAANAAFDSALRLLPAEDRERLDRLERLLSPAGEAALATSSDAVRGALNVQFWLAHDRLWSMDHDSPRIEFLARAAYSEFRWTVDETGLRGADSDRGNIHIRYGPPDWIYALAPNPALHNGSIVQFWSYKNGLVFAFWGAPTFGTMHFPAEDRSYVNAMTADVPVRFDNIDPHVQIDSLPYRVARFRGGDSVDVIVATQAPVDSIKRTGAVVGPVQAHTWLVRGGVSMVSHDSAEANAAAPTVVTRRVSQGSYWLRAEATQEGATYATTTSAKIVADADSVTGFALRGPGLSDLLIGTDVRARRERPTSWRDFDIAIHAGSHSRELPIAVVWETYGLADSAGQAHYEVAVTFERERGRAGRIIARVLGAIADAVRTDDGGTRMTIRFDRVAPRTPTIAEGIPIGIAGTPPGVYRLTVQVTDRVTGRSMSRFTHLEIRD